jgi:hypothetical protein
MWFIRASNHSDVVFRHISGVGAILCGCRHSDGAAHIDAGFSCRSGAPVSPPARAVAMGLGFVPFGAQLSFRAGP